MTCVLLLLKDKIRVIPLFTALGAILILCQHILGLFLTHPTLAKIVVKFIYSEKATEFCEIFTLLLTTVHTVKSNVKISQNFVTFSEYINFSNYFLRRWSDETRAPCATGGLLK